MMIVVAPTVTEDGLPAVVERVTGFIETQEGSIESFTHDNPWGHRRLAYPIQNFRDAFYVLFYFNAAPRAIAELERELRLDAAIIRHLIVKFDPLTVRDGEDEGEPEASDGEPATPAAAASTSEENEEAAESDAGESVSEAEEPEPEATETHEEDGDDGSDDSDDDGEDEAEAEEAEAEDGEDEAEAEEAEAEDGEDEGNDE